MADLHGRADVLRRRARWCRDMARRTGNAEVADALRELADELEAAAAEIERQSGGGPGTG